MTNTAKITITAVDEATAVMLKIRAQMRAMTQPMRDIKTSMGRFAQASGLKKVGQDLRKVGHAAGAVARGVTKTIAPMAALIGAGTIGGVAELANSWGQLGWSIERTAQTIGVAPQKLQALQGAAKLAGLSADDMTSSLGRLGTTLQDALYGRNQQALATLNYLGISIHKTATGAVDSTRALSDLSRVMQKYNGQPQVQQKIAGEFGLELLLPLLRQGPEAIRKFEVEAKRLGYVLSGPELQRATLLGKSFTDLQMSLTGVRNSISDALFPVLQPLLVQMTNWISANRQLVGTRVAEWVAEIAALVRSVNWGAVWQSIKQTVAEIRNIAVGISSAVQSLGGWKSAIEDAFGAAALAKMGIFIGKMFLLRKLLKNGLPASTAAPAASDAFLGLGLGGLFVRGGLLGLAGYGGYKLGKNVINPLINSGVDALSGGKEKNLGGAVYDWLHPGEDKRLVAKTLFPAMESHYGLPKGLLDATWAQESSRGEHLYSPNGAVGDFQFMPATAAAYGLKNPLDFDQSTVAAAKMYGGLLKHYHNDISKALGAYNWGSGNLDKDIAKHGADWLAHAPRETQDYVNQIQGRMAGVKRPYLYGQGRIGAPQASAPQASATQRVDVHISMGNVPPGTKVTATDGNGHNVPVRVGRNLVGAS